MSRKSKKKGKNGIVAGQQAADAFCQDYPRTLSARETQNLTSNSQDRWIIAGVCALLPAIVWIVFGQTLHHEFINLDDPVYVTENAGVLNGFTFKRIAWLFTHAEANFYHPLTMISLMLDHEVFGLWAGGYHLTNVLLHCDSAILLFLVLRRMTGSIWRSAFVAAIFAIHPLRVETVVWVSERKDVLSALFFVLTLLAYARYVRLPKSLVNYAMVLAAFAASLMSKPTGVTLPFVLLLIDYWPLGRARSLSDCIRWPLVQEKIPLILLSFAFSVITFRSQGKAVATLDEFSIPVRIGNAVLSTMVYLRQMVWPTDLAPFYPFHANLLSVGEIAFAAVALVLLSTGAFLLSRERPYLIVGWLWYLGMLVPMSGLVQISTFAHADRFTYLPQIGIYILTTWGIVEMCAAWHRARIVLAGAAAGAVLILSVSAHRQTALWQNSEALWRHTLASTSGNPLAHNNLGTLLLEKGQVDQAIIHFQKALEIRADYVEAQNNLGNALLRNGRTEAAIEQYERSLKTQPNSSGVYYNLGKAFLQIGRVDDAISCFRQTVAISPRFADGHFNLGNALFQAGHTTEGIAHYQEALRLDPLNPETHNNLGNAFLQARRLDEALAQYKKALEIEPKSADVHHNLGYALEQDERPYDAAAHYETALAIDGGNVSALQSLASLLATCSEPGLRNGAKAVELGQQANRLTGGRSPMVGAILAAAYAESGRFPEALKTAEYALRLADAAGDSGLANLIQTQMRLYELGTPFHRQATPPNP